MMLLGLGVGVLLLLVALQRRRPASDLRVSAAWLDAYHSGRDRST